jgi:hypothetical protein
LKAAERLASGEVTITTIAEHYDISKKNQDLLIAEMRQMTEG